jgi:glycosyltransferase involved in cell wall biosynthesis
MLSTITPVLITYNEAPNIARTLSKLTWAPHVVIVDSLSDDATREAAMAAHPGVRWFERKFTTHGDQWNFALRATGITTDWVLALDADYVLTDDFIEELKALSPSMVMGYSASFVYCIDGHALRGAVYPPVTVLYRRDAAHYIDDGHAQRVQVPGPVRPLAHPILHDDRKPLAHWLGSQVRYMSLEADKLQDTPEASLALVDRARRLMIVAPPAMFLYCWLGKGGILDGWPGFFYAMQRATAEAILSLTLLERKMTRHDR